MRTAHTDHPTSTDRTAAATTEAPPLRVIHRHTRLFTVVALLAIIVGAGSILGGLAGGIYTYDQAAAQDITTPEDARFAEVGVRGPISMWAQSDIISSHQLESTEGLYYSQMEREAPMLDEAGEPVLDDAGEAVMGPNEARLSWVTATALTTALGLGIMAYALAAFAIAAGAVMLALGLVVWKIRNAELSLT